MPGSEFNFTTFEMTELSELFKRDGCVSCPQPQPSCNCQANELCILVARTCDSCGSIFCRKNRDEVSLSPGGIAGVAVGCVAAVILLAIGTYFYIKWNKRNNAPLSPQIDGQYDQKDIMSLDRQAGMEEVGSIQSYPDANIIPIAYIPNLGSSSRTSFPGPLPQGEDIRNSIATSNYRASLPAYVMAVQGQPNMVNVETRTTHSRGLDSISELAATPIQNYGNFTDPRSSPIPRNSDLNPAFESSLIMNPSTNTRSLTRSQSNSPSIREVQYRGDVSGVLSGMSSLGRTVDFHGTIPALPPSQYGVGSFSLSEFSFDTSDTPTAPHMRADALKSNKPTR